MKIDFAALGLVSVVSLTATLFVVSVTALGIRAMEAAAESERSGRPAGAQRAWSRLCFGVATLAVLFGIYLIVPALH